MVREKFPPDMVLLHHTSGGCGPGRCCLDHCGGATVGDGVVMAGRAEQAVDVVPAAAVPAFAPRPVCVRTGRQWQDGELHGWCRRPARTDTASQTSPGARPGPVSYTGTGRSRSGVSLSALDVSSMIDFMRAGGCAADGYIRAMRTGADR